jgi:hypothetical protein
MAQEKNDQDVEQPIRYFGVWAKARTVAAPRVAQLPTDF